MYKVFHKIPLAMCQFYMLAYNSSHIAWYYSCGSLFSGSLALLNSQLNWDLVVHWDAGYTSYREIHPLLQSPRKPLTSASFLCPSSFSRLSCSFFRAVSSLTRRLYVVCRSSSSNRQNRIFAGGKVMTFERTDIYSTPCTFAQSGRTRNLEGLFK